MLCVFTETSPPWLMGTQVIPGSMRILGIIWLTALGQLFFPGSCFFFSPLVSPYTCTDCYSAEYSGEPLHRFLELFLLVVPSAPVCYPASLPFFEAALSSLNSNLLFPQLHETAGFWVSPSSTVVRKLPPGRKPGQSKVSPCLFPSLRNHNLVLPLFQCLKIIMS